MHGAVFVSGVSNALAHFLYGDVDCDISHRLLLEVGDDNGAMFLYAPIPSCGVG
jgi:hypothetical protein